MSERDALLSAIRANPEDDTPRLVFADWLDENEPDAKPRAVGKGKPASSPSSWAALIRTECELARLENDGSAAQVIWKFFREKDDQAITGVRWENVEPGVARQIELHARAEQLRRASARARKAGLPQKAGVSLVNNTHRGFPAEVLVNDGEKLFANIDRLIAFCPAVTLCFFSYPTKSLPVEAVSRGLLKWCRALALTNGEIELLAAMSGSPDAAGVRSVSFVGPGTAEVAVAWLSSLPHWGGLRELSIHTYNGFNRESAVRLLRGTPHLRQLTRLEIQGDGNWNRNTIQELAGFTELRELRLIGCGLDDSAARVLANMPDLANLRWLDLENNQITGRGASELISSAHLKNLTILDLESNSVRGLDRKALATAPAGGLRLLGFHGCRLTVNDVSAICSSPRTSEVLYIDFDYNSLPESATARLAKGFGNRAPAILYLMGNNFTAAGIDSLVNWPAMACVDMLHLSDNTLTTTAAKAIASCPHMKQLNHICAATTHRAGQTALKKAFGEKALV